MTAGEEQSMDEQFEVNDIVVVKEEHATLQTSENYDYSAWAHVRMRITYVEHGMVTAQAIDERPDREWILRTHREGTGDPQDMHMYWPKEHLKKIS